MNPLISIIIPTHNRKHIIKRALDSVFKQTYKNWELLVVDDGSSDGSFEELQKISSPQVHIIKSLENKGVSCARNLGIKKSKGEWICFLDSDDEWLEEKLEKQILSFQKNKKLLIHTDEIWIRSGVRVNPHKRYKKQGGRIFIKSLSVCSISPSTTMIHKSVFDKVGLFHEDFIVCEDYELWLRITAQYEVDLVNEFLIRKYAGHEDQLSYKFKAMDYFRVRALHSQKNSLFITKEERTCLIDVLQKKCKILLNGYKKHNNMDHFKEVNLIFESSLPNHL